MGSDDGDGRWTRELLTGLAALVAGALLIGLVVAVVTLGAVDVVGIGDRHTRASSPPTLYMPTAEPTTRPEPYPDPVRPSSSPSPSAAQESPSPNPAKKRKPKAITLQAFPRQVGASERINLTGVYQRGEGATLQVQRLEGSPKPRWVDFPVSATVRGGIFETYVITGRSGANRFRVVDTGSGRASNPVRVTVG